MTQSLFSHLQSAAADPIVAVMMASQKDTDPRKVDVSVGVYKTEEGDPNYVFPSVAAAKKKLAENDPGHCYTLMLGIPAYTRSAQRTIFGAEHDDVISIQTISGLGSLHMTYAFLAKLGLTTFYAGTPMWANYEGMIRHVGGTVRKFRHYDPQTAGADLSAVLEALESCPEQLVFIFQAVCHNPTGSDYTRDQWREIVAALKKKRVFPIFDIAYQGFASGSVDEDAWIVRYAYDELHEFAVCQSYSKNMALYSERAGCSHIVVRDAAARPNVFSQLMGIVRSEISFAPAFGARVATIVQDDPELRQQWAKDVLAVTTRLDGVRKKVHQRLVELQTPGDWLSVTKQKGLFWYSGLTAEQVTKLLEEHHVYGTLDGRVNVAGLNDSNIERYCAALDAVVRKYPGN